MGKAGNSFHLSSKSKVLELTNQLRADLIYSESLSSDYHHKT